VLGGGCRRSTSAVVARQLLVDGLLAVLTPRQPVARHRLAALVDMSAQESWFAARSARPWWSSEHRCRIRLVSGGCVARGD
jgi:hypothetical protein